MPGAHGKMPPDPRTKTYSSAFAYSAPDRIISRACGGWRVLSTTRSRAARNAATASRSRAPLYFADCHGVGTGHLRLEGRPSQDRDETQRAVGREGGHRGKVHPG